MQLSVRDIKGNIVDQVEVKDEIFGVPFHHAVVHQAPLRQLNNARQGDANTKTRSEVAGSTRKLYPQKHTGRARQGSIRAPHRRGGGIVFGPHSRSYRQAMPRKMRHLALRSLLSAKAAAEQLVVVQNLTAEAPKTKVLKEALFSLGVGASALVVTREMDNNVIKSAANLPGVKTLPVTQLNVADLLNYRALVLSLDSLQKVQELWSPERDYGRGH